MAEVINIKFKNKGKAYYFDPAGLTVPTGSDVIVDTSKGLEYATCTRGNHTVPDEDVVKPLRPVARVATADDQRRYEENKRLEKRAYLVCQQKILQHRLDMKLVDVEYNFERSKILFFFTSEGRVDFRELVKDLAGIFKTRIELRQIGVRDEARMMGGLGICGRPFCCSQFLDDFHPVSIKMAKTQGLSLNPTKISGTCGRLMCCLKHEQEAYEDIVKTAPKNDAFVRTPAGYGSIDSMNLLRGTARVRMDEGNETVYKQFAFDELEVLGGKGKLAEYLAAKAEGRLAEAGFPPVEVKPRRLEHTVEPEFDRSWLTVGMEQQQEQAQPQPQQQRQEQGGNRGKRNHRRGGKPQSQAADKPRQEQPQQKQAQPAQQQKPQKKQHPNRGPKQQAQQDAKQTPRPAGEEKSGRQHHRRKRPQNKKNAE